MANVLVVAELAEDGKLRKSTLSAITFARQALPAVGGSLNILVLGASTAAAAAELGGFGAAKIITVEDASLAKYTAEHYAPSVVAAAQGHSLVLATASSYGKDLLPRVAARLDAAFAGDCAGVAVDGGKLVYKRPMFAGNAYGYCTLETPIQVATVRQSEFTPAEPSGGTSPVEKAAKAAVGAAAARVEFVGLEAVKSARPELGEAKVVVSGGRALKEKFNEVMEPLADAAGPDGGAKRVGERQDRRPAAVRRGRYLGRNPAHRRDEELEGHRRDQQGRRRADLRDRRLRHRRRPVRDRAGTDRGAGQEIMAALDFRL